MSNAPAYRRGFIVFGVCYLVLECVLYFTLPRRPAAVESIRYYFNRSPALDNSILQWKTHDLLTRQNQPYDVLYLGDCSCLMNVDPLALEKKTGLRGLNLGTIGFLYTDGFTDIVNLYLERYPPPKVVVYYLTPAALTTPYASIQRLEVLKKFRAWCGIPTANPLSHLPSYKAFFILKSWASRLWARPDALDIARGPFPSDREFRQIMQKNHGFMVDLDQYPIKPEKNPVFSPDCLPGLKRLFKLGQQRGFQVLIVMNPIPESFRNAETDAAYQAYYDRLDNVVRTFPNVHLGQPWLRYYPDTVFLTHNMDLEGIRQNSEDISRELIRYE